MKNLFVVGFLVIANLATGQTNFTPVDRALVEKAVTDPSRETFYDKLLGRFNDYDTTLTGEDYRLIYFGFAFQKNYSSFPNDKQQEINSAFKAGDYLDAIKICDTLLEKTPISLSANYNKCVSIYRMNKTDEMFVKARNRYNKLIGAILSSGDGLTCKSGFKVLFVHDEYEIMYGYFEIEGNNGQSLEYPCDHFKINPSKYFKADDIYFDTSEEMLNEEKILKGK